MRNQVKIGDKIVQRYFIIGTHICVYDVYEPDQPVGESFHNHSTITTIDSERYGEMTTRYLPEELDALPSFTQERIDAVKSYYKGLWEEAYKLIIEAYPQAAAGTRSSGNIETFYEANPNKQPDAAAYNCVVYRTGTPEKFQWHRSRPVSADIAKKIRSEVIKLKQHALIVDYQLSVSIGLPETY